MYFETIRSKDIDYYIEQGNAIIIDLRDASEYNQGHIGGAVNIPYEDIEDYVERLQRYHTIILYCDRGNISMLAARDLSNLGCKNIKSIYGGIQAYQGKLEK